MEKQKLIDLGISEETADKIVTLAATETKELEGKLATVNKNYATVKAIADKFDGVDIEKVKNDEYERGKKEVSEEFDKYKTAQALDGELMAAGAKNTKALRALLDMDKVTYKDGKFEGLTEQLDALKTDSDYLFNAADTKPTFTKGGNGGSATLTKEAFDKMGYNERAKLFASDPDTYKELNGGN